jgi:hypothetical protein
VIVIGLTGVVDQQDQEVVEPEDIQVDSTMTIQDPNEQATFTQALTYLFDTYNV